MVQSIRNPVTAIFVIGSKSRKEVQEANVVIQLAKENSFIDKYAYMLTNMVRCENVRF
jgi:hypothetical protein